MPTPRSFYSGVFLVSGCLMALQILQSRIFSVTTWYHLAFLVISIAMFGITLAALHVHRGDAQQQRAAYDRLMAKASNDLGICIVIALAAQLCVPIIYSSFWGTVFTLPLISLFTVLPYYKAGFILTLALTRAPFPVARTYGVDLIGAAAGCLLALLLMKLVDAPSAVMMLAALAFIAALCFGHGQSSAKKAKFLSVAVVIVAAVNMLAPQKLIYPVWIKSGFLMQDQLAHDEWNAISRITVFNEQKDVPPFLWGASPDLPPEMTASYHFLQVDGDAGTPITAFDGNREALKYLEYDVTTIAYAMPGIEKVGIIGVGGGRDVLSAHYFGAKEITALDVNNIQISLLTEKEPFKSYAGLAALPGLRLINGEARSWFARHRAQFDMIQMSLIDTWAATGAGAFALSENGLYTTDAWGVFLDDLKAGGVLTVSRWYTAQAANEMERLLALAVQTLFDQGVARPRDHIYVATAGRIATLVLAKSPFTPEQRAALESQAQKRGFEILIAPDQDSKHEMFNRIRGAADAQALQLLTAENPLDISPPTDNRPFFFNQVRPGNPLKAIALARSNTGQAILGHAKATLNLYLILIFALLMVVFVILLPLRAATRHSDKGYIAAGTGWFLLIGLGFMLLEVALLQRMSVFLGHPVYGLSVVLFSLVLSTGLGSLLSEKMILQTHQSRLLWLGATALAAFALSFVLPMAFALFAEVSLLVRALVCIALTVPLGLLLGFGFPTGMMLVEKIDSRPAAWFWGINGAAGVMGSALAVAFNIALGLSWTIVLGGICYALLALPSFRLRPAAG